MKNRNTLLAAISALAVSTAGLTAQTVLYRQGFHNSEHETLTQFVPNVYAWESYFTTAATRVPGNRITYLEGGTALPNVNAPTPYGDNLQRGYWLMNVNTDQMAYTDLAVARDPELVMGMELRNDSDLADWRFLLRFSTDEWHVSEEAYSVDKTGSFEWDLFAIAAGPDSLWIRLNFEPRVVMELSAEPARTLASISGDIVGVGFHGAIRSATKRYRIDNFTVGIGNIFPQSCFTHPWTTDFGGGIKYNRLGWLDDAAFPHVFFFGMETWAWVLPASEDPEELLFLWSYKDSQWYWTGVKHYPEIYPVAG